MFHQDPLFVPINIVFYVSVQYFSHLFGGTWKGEIYHIDSYSVVHPSKCEKKKKKNYENMLLVEFPSFQAAKFPA